MKTLATAGDYEEIIKGSRFIVKATPVSSEEEANAFFEEHRDPEATHNCWAWKIGNNYRFSDDGEPGGTAGRPMFTAIERQELDRVAVLVIRHFGGTKLGAGGLVRAYGGTTGQCLRDIEKEEILTYVTVVIDAPFDCLNTLHHHLKKVLPDFSGQETYTATGLSMEYSIPEHKAAEIEEVLTEASQGKISCLIDQ